jgi:tRNA modification GTPase
MQQSQYGSDEPICALATPFAPAALAIIRVSGKGCLECLASAFSAPKTLLSTAGNTIVHGWIINNNKRIDEVLVSVYRAPRSYTGEDGADVNCHGGPAVITAVLEALREAGLRQALPGEFTFRAFMNGKLDLTRAESVMEVVYAKTDAGRARAVKRLSGELEQEVRTCEKILTDALASVEVLLDYSEIDGVTFADDAEAEKIARNGGEAVNLPLKEIAGAKARSEALSASFAGERLFQDAALVVIAGPANAGKSSRFNRIIREDRSIVTNVPGTTRDWIEAEIDVGGMPVRLVDTAGLRESGEEIEKIGIAKAHELIEDADAVIYLVNEKIATNYTNYTNISENKLICVWNKADIALPPANFRGTTVSAKTGAGVQALLGALAKLLAVRAAPPGERAGAGTKRQKDLLDRAAASLGDFQKASGAGDTLDLSAPCLRDAVEALGEISGEVSTADMLEAMFSKFCVGK